MRKFARFGVPYLPLGAALCVALAIGICEIPTGFNQAAHAETAQAELPTTEFETRVLTIQTVQGRFEFEVEIADEPGERQKGLMFRETMPAKSGMLFDFGQTGRIQMWMRNTPLPLDMIFIQPDGMVVNIAERTTPFSDAIIDSKEPVSHVLEVNAGISKLIGLKIGDSVKLPEPGSD